MATVSFANNDQNFDISEDIVDYSGGVLDATTSSLRSWISPFGHDSDILGTGFTYDVVHAPTGGTVAELVLDLNNDNGLAELHITGLSFNATLLAPLVNGGLTPEQQNDLYWRTFLSGNDTVDLGNTATTGNFYVVFAGDGRNVASGQTFVGGNDIITGDAGGGYALGDFMRINAGGSVFGGNDTITLTGGTGLGDAFNVTGLLSGGDDKLAGGSASTLFGDAYRVYLGGTVIGGNDTLTLSGDAYAVGDIYQVVGNLAGGDDIINGSAGDDHLIGDAVIIYRRWGTGWRRYDPWRRRRRLYLRRLAILGDRHCRDWRR
ncbi:hypothetical protein ACFSQT_38755 [Mesorhizobium calcicola]|uniref:Calcium-binding protein n=1 Tax=Mesorhizobium calcicola TaxID=1300310 RepID=A0ABW4WT29_9HYPH